ncbi:gephyrin-like molybdotransferase Glp [Stygiolobus caldivivus]|uniref:Molybdopterin molybdenumtransferase MoeA n=1 Tax=Stygiolobus caldivivus TaxID=2824673 RepID=A0A8D5U4A6_9CREN|nr:gephyrin-like molybdotransferase Glp [Stygiolobus caldivivus]BCU69003.1 molybdopterin molybdenumtransferase MoeA [Stygiolobus caldivivus]
MRAILKEENLLTPEEALQKLIYSLSPSTPEIEEVDIINSLGRISASDVHSPLDLPPFSRSTVDGYAVIADDTPGELKVIGKISIGEGKDLKVERGEAVEVDTGATIPRGATAVVKVEETIREGDTVKITKKLKFGENIGWVGSDIPKGTLVLRKGERITPEKIALLASVGINKVKVYRKIKIYIITTGNELVKPGESLSPGKIYESNSYYLASRLRLKGYEVVGTSLVSDDKEKIREELYKGISSADVVILTGGTSAGEKDFVHEVIREEGKIIVHGIKFKPGKPTILAEVKGKPVFGLPGNMVSTIMISEQIVEKYLSLKNGGEIDDYITVKAKAINKISADKKRFTYIPVFLFKREDEFYCLAVPFDSYMIGTFSLADGYIGLNPGEEVNEGESVRVYVRKLDTSPVYIGEEEPTIMSKLPQPFRMLPLGSLAAIKALKYGIGDILVVSDIYPEDVKEKEDLVLERDVMEVGDGDEIGYWEWVGISKIVQNPVVKLRYPSSALNFIGKAKIFVPSTILNQGKAIRRERLKVFIRNSKFKNHL